MRIEKTVFIGYNRANMPWALAIYQYLTTRGYDVFFDFHSIDSGQFEEIIFQNIKARAHFILLLSERSVEDFANPNDWLRPMIEFAIETKRNIIPLMIDGFDFDSPLAQRNLIGKLALIKAYNGVRVPAEYFNEAMERLASRYLNVPLDTVLHPLSSEAAVKVDKSPEKQTVFLCHAAQDKPFVRRLYKNLTKDGFDAWLDEEKILPGQDWDMEIELAIERSDAVIICLSNNSVNKEGYVQKEMRYIYEIALEKPEGTIFVIPIRIDECTIPRRIRHFHYEDFFPDSKEANAYQRIKRSLELKSKSKKG